MTVYTMTIRIKLILGLCLLLALLGVGILTIFQTRILPDIHNITRDHRLVDLSRVEQGIDQELKRIELALHDWGWWDDTYRYAAEPNREYEQTNLTQDWLQHIKLDLIVIVGSDGQLLASQFSEAGQALAGRFIADNLAEQGVSPLLEEGGTGLMLSPVGPLLIASCQILPTNRAGPSRGHLYFGRLVSHVLVSELAAKLRLPVQLELVAEAPSAPLVRELSDQATLSEMTLPLLNTGTQALRISLEQERPFYQRTLASARYSLTLIFCVAVVAGLAAYLYLERALVRPILALKLESEHFGRIHRPDDQYFEHLAGRDEVGQLAHAFAQMAQRAVDQRSLLERERVKFEQDSLTDPLTGLGNRRYLDQSLATDRALNRDVNRLVAMIDLDHFKRVNDSYGHDVGDLVLRQMADLLRHCCRQGDTLVRSGGEEFILVCRGIDEDSAYGIVERIRRETFVHRFGNGDQALRMSCSLGFLFCLKSTACSMDEECDKKLIKIADQALYQAKSRGRNTCVGYRGLGESDSGVCPLSNIDGALTEVSGCCDRSKDV